VQTAGRQTDGGGKPPHSGPDDDDAVLIHEGTVGKLLNLSILNYNKV
jgi:hypothetical protein